LDWRPFWNLPRLPDYNAIRATTPMGNGKTLDENWLEEKEAELLCECGSGLYWERKYDAQGIYLCRVCDQCRVAKLRGYRPEILSHYTQADVDEPIDEN
jgi:hypothetical protein